MPRAADAGVDPGDVFPARPSQHPIPETGVSQARGSLAGAEVESLRALAGAFVELAIQMLGDEKKLEGPEEAMAA
ncbi:MAG: hypothetical protein ABR507_02535 [Actinomycetota bacterium]